MNSSNSFNICPRCGNSNALNAKYCSRCGGQLKVPEEPVVCHKCRTHNTPMANFCRNCGTPLKVGAETKICPRCGKEVSGDKGICECGYSFVTYQQTLPSADRAVAVSGLREEQPQPKSGKVYSKKGGRGWAIAGIIFVLLFVYLIVAPIHLYNGGGEVLATLRPEFLVNFDKGLVNIDGDAATGAYGYDFVWRIVVMVKDIIQGTSIGEIFGSMGVGFVMLLALTVIFIVTAFVHFIVCLVRSFTAKRSKRMNIYFLILAILSTLVVGLTLLFQLVAMPEGFLQTVAGWFKVSLDETALSLGYVIWAIPLYFWFFFFYSLCAKAKRLKENA